MSIRSRLLAWYDAEHRDLPWRRTRDPYAIWVSEIMCQQTRVDTAIPYYERFMKRFPTVKALARADEDAVLSMWSGLGYYRRARLLHQGAREVLTSYAGTIPRDPVERLALPGIGRYTAGAIGSIAFHQEEPIVDGNVMRVLSRVYGIRTPLGRRDTENAFWEKATELVRGERPGDFNQSLMELGALVCTPTSPNCGACPIRRSCVAAKNGLVDKLPVAAAKKAPVEVDLVAVVACARGEKNAAWYVRSSKALFGGLWNLPMSEGHGRRSASKALSDAGLKAKLVSKIPTLLTHILSHRRMRVEVWTAVSDKTRGSATRKYVRAAERTSLGVSRLTAKVLSHTRHEVE